MTDACVIVSIKDINITLAMRKIHLIVSQIHRLYINDLTSKIGNIVHKLNMTTD